MIQASIQPQSCAGCGHQYMRRRKTKYCSDECRINQNTQRYKAVCKHCGDEFASDKKHRKFCSRQCHGRYKTKQNERLCKHCNKVFVPRKLMYGTYCTRECAFAGKATTHWKTKPPMWMTRMKKAIRNQQEQYKRASRRCEYYCRDVVGWHADNKRGNACCRCCDDRLNEVNNQWRQLRSLICVMCQSPRESTGTLLKSGSRCKPCIIEHKKQITKKYKTGNHRKRCKAAGTKYDPSVTRQTLLEADGRRCRICNKLTRPDYNFLHDLYPSIDHIVPIAKGGSHTWDNVQVAHRICNSRKSANSGGQRRLC